MFPTPRERPSTCAKLQIITCAPAASHPTDGAGASCQQTFQKQNITLPCFRLLCFAIKRLQQEISSPNPHNGVLLRCQSRLKDYSHLLFTRLPAEANMDLRKKGIQLWAIADRAYCQLQLKLPPRQPDPIVTAVDELLMAVTACTRPVASTAASTVAAPTLKAPAPLAEAPPDADVVRPSQAPFMGAPPVDGMARKAGAPSNAGVAGKSPAPLAKAPPDADVVRQSQAPSAGAPPDAGMAQKAPTTVAKALTDSGAAPAHTDLSPHVVAKAQPSIAPAPPSGAADTTSYFINQQTGYCAVCSLRTNSWSRRVRQQPPGITPALLVPAQDKPPPVSLVHRASSADLT